MSKLEGVAGEHGPEASMHNQNLSSRISTGYRLEGTG